MFLYRRPSSREIHAFISRAAEMPLSYGPVGIAAQTPAGFNADNERIVVGRGESAFSRAKAALAGWRHFDLGWVEVFPPRPPVVPGTVVAVLVHHLGFWSINACRIVYSVTDNDKIQQFGFAYGTLVDHAEAGEEVFKVCLNGDTGEVFYDIRAVSRPRAALARLGYPVTRMLQARFRRDSMAIMREAVG